MTDFSTTSFLRRLAVVAVSGTVLAASPALGAQGDDDQWHFRITPYLWLPQMSSSVDKNVPGPVSGEPRRLDLSASASADNYLDNLQMAVMLSAEARKGRWSVLTDIIYTDFGNEGVKLRHAIDPDRRVPVVVSRQGRMDLSATVWTLAGGYRVVDNPSVRLDLLAGARYLDLSSDLKISFLGPTGRYLYSHKVSLDQANWDGIVGLRGEVPIRRTQWFVPFYADIGTGDSELTWQAMLGIGYRFDWGDATLAWRALSYDLDDGNMDLTMSGPGMSVAFRW